MMKRHKHARQKHVVIRAQDKKGAVTKARKMKEHKANKRKTKGCWYKSGQD